MNRWKTLAATAAALALVGGAGIAYGQAQDPNPVVPAGPQGDTRTFADGSYESEFTPITPCRIVDTRDAGGKLAAGTTRTFDVRSSSGFSDDQGGKAGGCAIPAGTSAVEVTVTAVDAQNGFLRVWPASFPQPDASFMGYDDSFNVSNTGTVGVCGNTGQICLANQDLRVQAANGSTHVVIDVQGYYQKPLAAVVTAGGTLTRGSRVAGVEKLDGVDGTYRVAFDRDISECQWSVNVGGVAGGDPSGWAVAALATGSGGGDTKVFVHTRDASGASANREFHLVVTC